MEADKKFIIIGNMNAITFGEVFPLMKDNKIWLGRGFDKGNAYFRVEVPRTSYADGVYNETTNLVKFRNCAWFTNLDHGRRHQPLDLMKANEIFKYSKHKDIRGRKEFLRYINYDAIEIPYTDSIPIDYDGAMGVPISFLDRYCPEQFEILGIDGGDMGSSYGVSANLTKEECHALFREHKGFRKGKLCYRNDDGKLEVCYRRVLIRKKQ